MARLTRSAGLGALALIAGTGLFWIAATALGAYLGWDQRTRALCDLVALAAFGYAIFMLYGLWRDRQKDKD